MIPGCGLANGTTWVSWTGIPIFPCSSFSCDVQKQLAFKTKIGESKSKSRKFLHSKSKTRLACWNVRSPGVLNAQGLKLQHVIQTMIEKKNTDFWLFLSHIGKDMVLPTFSPVLQYPSFGLRLLSQPWSCSCPVA